MTKYSYRVAALTEHRTATKNLTGSSVPNTTSLTTMKGVDISNLVKATDRYQQGFTPRQIVKLNTRSVAFLPLVEWAGASSIVVISVSGKIGLIQRVRLSRSSDASVYSQDCFGSLLEDCPVDIPK